MKKENNVRLIVSKWFKQIETIENRTTETHHRVREKIIYIQLKQKPLLKITTKFKATDSKNNNNNKRKKIYKLCVFVNRFLKKPTTLIFAHTIKNLLPVYTTRQRRQQQNVLSKRHTHYTNSNQSGKSLDGVWCIANE